MAHRWRHFSAEDEDRRKWQDPEAILADLGVKPGITFMDIGCGEGFFALPAARAVGETGRVYALDSDPDSISSLKTSAAKEGLTNVTAIAGRAEDLVLCQACADIIFFGIVLHDFDDPARALANARKMVKPGGQLVDLDWKKQRMASGPPFEKRFAEQQAGQLIEQAGFKIETTREVGTFHYMIIARPSLA